jgi:hypothetical protein
LFSCSKKGRFFTGLTISNLNGGCSFRKGALMSVHLVRKLNDVDLSYYQYANDKGGRRTGLERRQFSYSVHIPERRSGKARRQAQDRRKSKTSQ